MKKDTAQKKKSKASKAPKDVLVPMVALDYERLKTVSGVVQLKDIFLNHSHWHSLARASQLDVGPAAMTFSFMLADATWDLMPDLKLLEIQLEYRLIAHAKFDGESKSDGNEVALFRLDCNWEVIFGVPDDFTPTNLDALADFTVANGQLNAFPYVRQYVQELTGRAGWPPLVLPTFRVPAKRSAAIGGRRQQKEIND